LPSMALGKPLKYTCLCSQAG